MNEIPLVNYSFQQIQLNDKPFFPLICFPEDACLDSNVVVVKLNSNKDADLDWEKEKLLAVELVEKGKLILWEFDLGLEKQNFNLMDIAQFHSSSLVLDQFSKTLWADFKNATFGVCLYRGKDLFSRLLWSKEMERNFLEWLEDVYSDIEELNKDLLQSAKSFSEIDLDDLQESDHARFLMRKFSSNLIGEYLQRLVSFLPDTLAVFAFFDLEAIQSLAERALLFLRNRFQHIHLGFRNSEFSMGCITWNRGVETAGWLNNSSKASPVSKLVSTGVMISEDALLKKESFKELEDLLRSLLEKGVEFRVVSEALFTEEWDGLDYAIFFTHKLGNQGKRKLAGFAAAGGVPVYIDSDCGAFGEISLSEFLNSY